jgi:hypothetical protein
MAELEVKPPKYDLRERRLITSDRDSSSSFKNGKFYHCF